MDRIKPDEGIVTGKRTLLPGFDLGDQFIRDTADRGVRYLKAVNLRDVPGDIEITHAQAKHRDDFALDLVTHVGLVFLHQLRPERSRSVSRRCQLETARGRFYRLATISIFTIRNLISLQMHCHFGFQRGFRQLFYQRRQNAVLARQILAVFQGRKSGIKIAERAASKSKSFRMCHSFSSV